MDSLQVDRPTASGHPARRACLVPGCPCKDARIVSHRRAAFFASWARNHGETADRAIAPDPAWSFASFAAPAAPAVQPAL